jgi:hypothetical protein
VSLLDGKPISPKNYDNISQTYDRRKNLQVVLLYLQAQGLFYVRTSKRVIRTAKSLYYFNFKNN